METGIRISKNLDKLPYSLKEIAELAGISYSSFVQMKRRNDYKTSAIDKIAKGLKIDPMDLLFDKPNASMVVDKYLIKVYNWEQ